MVSCSMETSVPGIFAGGNVVHVNDLVDNVTLEGELAGASAADFAMGKPILKGRAVQLKAGENVRYIVPQTVFAGQDAILSLRVKEPAERVRLEVGGILSKGFRAVRPGQMVRVAISRKEWQKMSGEVRELVVSCTQGGSS